MQGQSVLDFLAGEADTPYPGAEQVGYELFGLKAFFVGDWKILRMPKPFGTGEWELINLKQDPAEMIDLGKQYPRKLENMIMLWEQYKIENRVLDISLDLSGLK
jgi:arylsulfatase